MQEQKKLHEAKLSKLTHDHEAELEEQAKQVQEARYIAQSVKKAHRYAEREYTRAKTSCTMQAQRMKEMELKERRCAKLLWNMDKRLAGKLYPPSAISQTSIFSMLTAPSVGVLLQMPFQLPMPVLPMQSRSSGK